MFFKKTVTAVVSLAAALVMYGAMKNTCPTREQHMTAVNNVVEKTLDKIFEERIQFPDESREIANYLALEVIPQAVEKLTNERIDYTDYGVISLGSIEDGQGDGHTVSVGIFGKVFTITEDMAHDYLSRMIDDMNLETILQQQQP